MNAPVIVDDIAVQQATAPANTLRSRTPIQPKQEVVAELAEKMPIQRRNSATTKFRSPGEEQQDYELLDKLLVIRLPDFIYILTPDVIFIRIPHISHILSGLIFCYVFHSNTIQIGHR